MSDESTKNQNPNQRKGAVPRPVQPVGAVVESVTPFDPLRLGVLTYPLRRPKTRHLLETEFALTRKQAYAVAVHAAQHKPTRRTALVAALKFWLMVAFGVVVLSTIFGPILYTQYLRWILTLKPSDPATAVSVLLGISFASIGLCLWFAAERWIMDRIVDREIRRCWGDQECIWCGRDMAGCVVDRERWSRCPECGMRSPIGARASTI
jgi:hypothetical protein